MRGRTLVRPLLATVLALAVWLPLAAPVRAATITVTTLADDNGTNPATCSLREAITAANSNAAFGGCAAGSPGADTIVLGAGSHELTRDGAGEDLNVTGDLDITEALTIQGAGQISTTIRGDSGWADRILHVNADVPLTLTNLTIQGGNVAGPGGAIYAPSTSAVTLDTVSVIFNDATGVSGDGGAVFAFTVVATDSIFGTNASSIRGGAIFTTASVTISNTTFTNNNAGNVGGAIYAGASTVSGSRFTSNSAAGAGGAIAMPSGARTLTVTASTFSDNESTVSSSGAIHLAAGNTVRVTGSTFAGNSAAVDGGVAFILQGTPEATLEISNSTISGNSANNNGGAFFAGGNLVLRSTTVTNNRAGAGGAGGAGGGVFRSGTATGDVDIENSILAGNLVGTGTTANDCSGALAVFTYSLISTSSGCTLPLGPNPTNHVNVAALLDTLGTSSGQFQTHRLLPGSPAVDAGNDVSGCRDAAGVLLATDQRGQPRSFGGRCDMGAHEVNPPVAVADAYAATAGTPLVVPFGGTVLNNDVDREGAGLTVALATNVSNGDALPERRWHVYLHGELYL